MKVNIVEDVPNAVSCGLVAYVSVLAKGRLANFDDVTVVELTRREARTRPANTPLRVKLVNSSIVSRRAMVPTYVETNNWKVQWGQLVASKVESGQTESLKQLAMCRFGGNVPRCGP